MHDKTLTRESLLTMPDGDYMNDAQKAFFKGMLLDLRAELLARTQPIDTDAVEIPAAPDPVDRASQEEERAMAHRERERAHLRVREVDAALVRIERDEFGYCEVTGDEIGLARLLANPTAQLSLEAQQQREREKKFYAAA